MSDDGWETDDESEKKNVVNDIRRRHRISLKKDLQYLKKTTEDKLDLFEEINPSDERIPDGWVKKAKHGRIYYKNLITGENKWGETPQTSSKQIINSPWGKIKYGMNQEEVLKILGYPKQRLCYNGNEEWIYIKIYERDENTIYEGDVNFSVSNYSGCYLSSWVEPYNLK
tara:strand:- start:812 stop:1321 length:510 start_codon:yes stop_codon:yes gene_type:complete